jgi:ATP-dependent DNA helicase RecG
VPRASPPESLALSDPIARLPGIGPARIERLGRDGIRTVADLLLQLPFRYEDRRRFGSVASLKAGEAQTVRVRLAGVRSTRMRRGLLRIEGVASDETGPVRVVWHNRYPSFASGLASGDAVILYGAPAVTPRGELRLENPETEIFHSGEENDPLHSGRIVGIYSRGGGGLAPRVWRTLVRRALDGLRSDFAAASIPPAGLRAALEQIHFPSCLEEAAQARRVLAGEELLVLAAGIEEKRARLRQRPGRVLTADDSLRRTAREILPFALTGAQKRALREISADLASGRAMARLLQGDVGSGKTVVAGLAMLLAACNGVQAAFMAPTEILAEQHAGSLEAWLARGGVRMGLLTGRVRGRPRRALLDALAAGEIDALIGTHALIESPVAFRDLALVIVDEQHRFGVAHRARLFGKGRAPHVLVMTATPIPRSLAWAIYGELDVSVLDEKPAGRSPVITAVREQSAREKVYRFAAERVAAGERAYVVVPAIDEGEREVAATRDTAARIVRSAPGVTIAVLHGRVPPDQRAAVLESFRRGDVGILVATTVVEVGVDVPEATVMIVENAEVFGLAQLHQLRGRVGRGNRRSWCALIVGERAGEEARRRLAVLAETSDGFVIAERDLEARGPGDLLGIRQSGLAAMRVADPVHDLARLADARREVLERGRRGEGVASDLFPRPQKISADRGNE